MCILDRVIILFQSRLPCDKPLTNVNRWLRMRSCISPSLDSSKGRYPLTIEKSTTPLTNTTRTKTGHGADTETYNRPNLQFRCTHFVGGCYRLE